MNRMKLLWRSKVKYASIWIKFELKQLGQQARTHILFNSSELAVYDMSWVELESILNADNDLEEKLCQNPLYNCKFIDGVGERRERGSRSIDPY